jgi:hypothetical protein
VSKVNGRDINSLTDMKKAMAAPENGYHIIRFEGMDDSLILKAENLDSANREILRDYGISEPEYFKHTDNRKQNRKN